VLTGRVAHAHRLFTEAVAALSALSDDAASDDELISVIAVADGITRQLDRVGVAAVAVLERRGTFAERGYRSTTAALTDLCGWDRIEARRRVIAAEQVCLRIGLDGTACPPRLPATAAAFAAGAASLRHVEVVTRIMGSDAARRLTAHQRAAAETQLADKIIEYAPAQLLDWGSTLVELLDQDGPEPDDRPPAPVNELHLHRHRDRPGGTLSARFDDAAMFDAVATAVDAHARPRCAEDGERPAATRQAQALADLCGYVLDHGALRKPPGAAHT